MIYVDNAATSGYKPQIVIDAVSEYLKHPGNPHRGSHHVAMDAARIVLDTRMQLAALFDCQFQHIVFTSGITESLNTVINGLFHQDDHIIITYLEHNSVLRPLYRINCDLSICYPYLEDMKKHLQPHTKAIIMNHVSNVTGEINDLKEIGQFCHDHHLLFIVDCAQSAGLVPISMKENHIDILCFTGHKGLMAMQGIGGIALAKDFDIQPLKVGGSGNLSFSREHPMTYPTRLEAGTLNVPGIVSLHASIDYIQEKGIHYFLKHEQELADTFYQNVKDINGIHVYREDGKKYVGIVSLNIEGKDANWVSDQLSQHYHIETRAGAHCAPLVHEHYQTESMIRFSFGYHNTMEDVYKCIEALKSIIKGDCHD